MEFEEIYRLYFQDVFKYIRGLSADEHLAEEITSETFFKAFKAIDDFKGDCDVRVWLCQIAKNTFFTHAKKSKRLVNIEDDSEIEQTQESIEHLLVNKEEAFRIHQALHTLSEPYKEVFSLRIFGELSFKQIALLFGKSEHWACVTFHRAKEKIRRELEHEN